MRVYLAAPYGAREYVGRCADELARLGLTVTSTWLTETHDINAGTQGAATDLDDATVSEHAVTDLADIRGSDLLVLFTAAAAGVEGGGGRHVETGFALALNLPVLVIGEPENVFHRLKGGWAVDVVPDWHGAVLELGARALRVEREHVCKTAS